MSLPSPDFDRGATLEKSQAIKAQASLAISELNAHLSDMISSDGVVVYGLDPDTRLASVLGTSPAPTPELKAFRSEHIHKVQGYAVDLGVSGLGRQLRTLMGNGSSSVFETSRLGSYRHRHQVWAPRPIFHGDTPVIVPQLAFDTQRGTTPDQEKLEAIWDMHSSDFAPLAASVHDLIHDTPLRLHRSLELQPSRTPNCAVIRCDLNGSTRLALSSKYGAMLNFLEQWEKVVKDATENIPNVTTGEGDGQNIIVMLPESVDSADPDQVLAFQENTIGPIVRALKDGQRHLAEAYPDLRPNMSIATELGYVEQSTNGSSLNTRALWAVSRDTKNK